MRPYCKAALEEQFNKFLSSRWALSCLDKYPTFFDDLYKMILERKLPRVTLVPDGNSIGIRLESIPRQWAMRDIEDGQSYWKAWISLLDEKEQEEIRAAECRIEFLKHAEDVVKSNCRQGVIYGKTHQTTLGIGMFEFSPYFLQPKDSYISVSFFGDFIDDCDVEYMEKHGKVWMPLFFPHGLNDCPSEDAVAQCQEFVQKSIEEEMQAAQEKTSGSTLDDFLDVRLPVTPKRKSSKPKKLERDLEAELLYWLDQRGVMAEQQVASRGKRTDVWIPGKCFLELKRGRVTGDDVCQAAKYFTLYSRQIILVGETMSPRAGEGISAINAVVKEDALAFVTWSGVRTYLEARLA